MSYSHLFLPTYTQVKAIVFITAQCLLELEPNQALIDKYTVRAMKSAREVQPVLAGIPGTLAQHQLDGPPLPIFCERGVKVSFVERTINLCRRSSPTISRSLCGDGGGRCLRILAESHSSVPHELTFSKEAHHGGARGTFHNSYQQVWQD